MPTMNFRKQFVQPILEGSKVHTVRFSKRPVRKGQLLYCQTGSRFAPSRFAVLPAMRVRKITLSRETLQVWNEDKPSGFIVPARDKFAQADGFKNWDELRAWFDATYGSDRGELHGCLVQWAEADWEK